MSAAGPHRVRYQRTAKICSSKLEEIAVMRKAWQVFGLALLLLAVPSARPQAAPEPHADIPHNLHWGLDLLRRDAYDDAEKEIFAGSRIPANGSLSASFRSFREQDGQFQGFDIISSQEITPRLQVFYLALEYEKAPHFIRFTLYRIPDGWVVLHFSFVENENLFDTLQNARP